MTLLRFRLTAVCYGIGCIDKRSSAELTEAINSMFRWYADSSVCYVYLSDVEHFEDPSNVAQQIRASRWFTRGWTLQELIAPDSVVFYDNYWRLLGDKTELLEHLNKITRIDQDVLKDRRALRLTSVAKRMSWAADRTTSRVEDRAYSLLGIFDVNMPMLYGEGRKAFQRLQEEIISTSATVDHSILAWIPPSLKSQDSVDGSVSSSLLSPSPDGFRHAQDIVSWALPQTEIFEFSQGGLRLNGRVTKERTRTFDGGNETVYVIALNCRYKQRPSTRIGIRLLQRLQVEELEPGRLAGRRVEEGEISYDRDWVREHGTGDLVNLRASNVRGSDWTRRTMTLARQSFLFPEHGNRVHVRLVSCAAGTYQDYDYNNHLLRLSVVHDKSLHGSLKIETMWLFASSVISDEVIDFKVRIMQPTMRSRPPLLTVQIGFAASEDDPIVTGETREYSTKFGRLGVSARYVHLDGELLESQRQGSRCN